VNPPKPAEIRELEGNRGHRPIPKPLDLKTVRKEPPTWIDTDARAIWKKISSELYAIGVLKETDLYTLAAYCQTYAKWKRVSKLAEISEDGIKWQNQEIKYLKEMRALSATLGLSPSDRTRLSSDKRNPEEEKWDKLLSGDN